MIVCAVCTVRTAYVQFLGVWYCTKCWGRRGAVKKSKNAVAKAKPS